MKYSVRYEIRFNHLGKIASRMRSGADEVQGRTVLMLVQAADPATPVDTGNMKNNKTISPGGGGAKGHVHWHAPYTGFVHNGTRYMAARPFIAQAAAQVFPMFVRGMQELATSGAR